MTIATVLAITAPARSAGRAATGRAQAARAGGTFDIRARGGATVAPSARVARPASRSRAGSVRRAWCSRIR